jgi:hypothetical protein
MKTLKESILKSVKAGKYSINPKDIDTYEKILEYAEFLFGDKITVIKDKPEFVIKFNDDLYLIISKYRDFSVICTFKDKSGNILWDFGYTLAANMDWESMFRLEEWCTNNISYYKNLIESCRKRINKLKNKSSKKAGALSVEMCSYASKCEKFRNILSRI